MKVGLSNGLGRNAMMRVVTMIVALGALAGFSMELRAADDAAGSGLRAVLPAEVPEDLSDAIAALPESWTAWGDKLTATLTDLYTKEGLDVAGQRQALAVIQAKVNTLHRTLHDPRYRSLGSQLAGLYGRLNRRLELDNASLDALSAGGAPELVNNLKALLAALDQYELNQSKVAAAEARRAYSAVQAAGGSGVSRLTNVLARHYLNYNLRIDASEAFLTKVVNQHRLDNGYVDDCILGAKVDGCQTTVSEVSVQLCPSNEHARINLVVTGHINSNTQGVTPQATVFTWGDHYFTAQKEIDFDGEQFWTGPAMVSVNANNYTTGAQTKFSGVPLFGRLADSIAVHEAENRRPESEAIAASRVTDRVVPQLDTEDNRDFGAQGANSLSLQKRIATWRGLGVYPDTKSYKSSDTNLYVNARVMAGDELGGAAPKPIHGSGVTLQIHESLINNSTDRAGLQGQTMTQDQVADLLDERISKLLGRSLRVKPVEKDTDEDKGPNTLIFNATDPIRVHAANGELNLTIRAAFRQEGKEDIPEQIVTLPIRFSVQGTKLVVERGEVSVAPAEKPDNVAKQITTAGVIKAKFENAMPRRELDRVLKIERPDHTTANATITRVDLVDGWVIILME